jgi:hypothetical protein
MIRTIWKVVLPPLLIWGCGDGSLNLSVHYGDIRGLSEKDRVVAAEVPIGEVRGITKKAESGYTVNVKIRKEFRHLATENATFTIVRDPAEKGRDAMNMERRGDPGPPLRDGASVEGGTAVAGGNGEAWEEFRRRMRDFKNELDEFSREFGKIPEREEFQRLKKEIERIGKELKRSGREAREKIEKEILPELERRFEELKEKFLKGKKGRELEPVQVRV